MATAVPGREPETALARHRQLRFTLTGMWCVTEIFELGEASCVETGEIGNRALAQTEHANLLMERET